MLKKQTTSNSAIRFGTSMYANNLTYLGVYNQQAYDQTAHYNFSISIGKEIQKQITKSWVFYYGADLSPFFDYDQRKSYYQNNSTVPLSNYILQYQTSLSSYGIKLIPFLGIRFNVNERLYIATQTNLFLSFNKKEVTQKNLISNSTNYDSNKKSMSEGSVSLSPASGIFFFYRF